MNQPPPHPQTQQQYPPPPNPFYNHSYTQQQQPYPPQPYPYPPPGQVYVQPAPQPIYVQPGQMAVQFQPQMLGYAPLPLNVAPPPPAEPGPGLPRTHPYNPHVLEKDKEVKAKIEEKKKKRIFGQLSSKDRTSRARGFEVTRREPVLGQLSLLSFSSLFPTYHTRSVLWRVFFNNCEWAEVD